MYGTLSNQTIEQMLERHRYGRLGFTADDEVYIIPINYGYDGTRIYGHAAPGFKIEAMRSHPNVALAIDEIDNPSHWRSVLLHGRYVELHDPAEKEAALRRVLAQAGGGERSEVTWWMPENLIVFRIDITDRSGRFEQREAMSLGALQRQP